AAVCEKGVRSLRADLAAVRASIAYAALEGNAEVQPHHVASVLPLVLAHRAQGRSPAPRPQPPRPEAGEQDRPQKAGESLERIFAPREMKASAVQVKFEDTVMRGASAAAQVNDPGPVIGARRTEKPV